MIEAAKTSPEVRGFNPCCDGTDSSTTMGMTPQADIEMFQSLL